MNVTVYLGSCSSPNPIYKEAAEQLGRYLSLAGFDLVYGASDCGNMAFLARAYREAGNGKIHGVGLRMFEGPVGNFKGIDDLYIAETFAERRNKMIELGDAFVALPGGTGTLDEISEVLCLYRFYFPQKPVLFLNVDSFFEGIKIFLQKAEKEGFIYEGALDNVFFPESVEEAKAILDSKLK